MWKLPMCIFFDWKNMIIISRQNYPCASFWIGKIWILFLFYFAVPIKKCIPISGWWNLYKIRNKIIRLTQIQYSGNDAINASGDSLFQCFISKVQVLALIPWLSSIIHSICVYIRRNISPESIKKIKKQILSSFVNYVLDYFPFKKFWKFTLLFYTI